MGRSWSRYIHPKIRDEYDFHSSRNSRPPVGYSPRTRMRVLQWGALAAWVGLAVYLVMAQGCGEEEVESPDYDRAAFEAMRGDGGALEEMYRRGFEDGNKCATETYKRLTGALVDSAVWINESGVPEPPPNPTQAIATNAVGLAMPPHSPKGAR